MGESINRMRFYCIYIVFLCVNVFLNGFSKVRVWKGFVVVR